MKKPDIERQIAMAADALADPPLVRENKQLREEVKTLRQLCWDAHSQLDQLMGDSDLPNDDSPLMQVMQRLAIERQRAS